MDAERFGAYIERRLSLYDDQIQLIDRNGMTLRLLARDEEQTISLEEFYRAYLLKPSQLDAVMKTLVQVVMNEAPADSGQDFSEIAERIFPLFKPVELVAEVHERGLPPLVYREFLADLIIVYAISEGARVLYVNEDHLDAWGASASDLHERALANLREHSVDVKYTTLGEGEQTLFIYKSGDGYDASRLLLTDTLADLARRLPGRMVIGIPSRDFLIAFSDANPDILQALAAQIQTDYIGQPNGLTDQLFTLDRGQVREYEWE
jgi:uncharacterized protein YtpQ (UPF0354 family)